ncbi:hypothetical protein Tco_1273198 [Tanacetum coccineum]
MERVFILQMWPAIGLDLEAQYNVENVQEHLVDEEIVTMVEGTENVDEDEFIDEIFNDQEHPNTRIKPESHKGSPKELTAIDPTPSSSTPKPKQDHFKYYKSVFHKMNMRYGYTFRHLQKSFILRRNFNEMANTLKAMFKEVVPLMTQTDFVDLVVEAVKKERENLQAKLSMQDYMSNNILHVHPTQAASSSVQDLKYQLYLKMKDDEQVCNANLSIWWSLNIMFEKPAPPVAPYRLTIVCTRDHEDHHDDDAHPEGESSAKRQRTSEYGTYIVGESSFEQVINESNPPGSDNDEVPSKEVSPELLEEISREVDEAQLHKVVNDMLRV